MAYTLKDDEVSNSLRALASTLNSFEINYFLAGGMALQLYILSSGSNFPLRPTNDADFSTLPPLNNVVFNSVYYKFLDIAQVGQTKKGKDREGFYICFWPNMGDPFFLHIEKPSRKFWEKIAGIREQSALNAVSLEIENTPLKIMRIEEIYACKIRRIIYASKSGSKFSEPYYNLYNPDLCSIGIEDPEKYLHYLETRRKELSSYFEASIEEGTRERVRYNAEKDLYDLYVILNLIKNGIDFDRAYLENYLKFWQSLENYL
jgi:hypothetical protein